MAIKTILIVEDDRFIGEMYVRSLKKAGYDVDWMIDGNDGLIAARNKQYDLKASTNASRWNWKCR